MTGEPGKMGAEEGGRVGEMGQVMDRGRGWEVEGGTRTVDPETAVTN